MLSTHRPTSSRPSGSSEPSVGASQEEQWVEQVREGSEEAFERIFFAYYGPLCAFVTSYLSRREVARDVVQEVFLKIWERHASWTVHSSLKAYLYQAVRNQALDFLRHYRITQAREVQLSSAAERMPGPNAADESMMLEEITRAVRQAILRLPARQQTAFILHRQHGLTYQEIAQVMKISPRTVEVHMSKALSSLVDAVPKDLL